MLRVYFLQQWYALADEALENAIYDSKAMREGTIVDAIIVVAAPSTKNKAKQRDPEMKQTQKGNQWYFGLKAHIGVDAAAAIYRKVSKASAVPTVSNGSPRWRVVNSRPHRWSVRHRAITAGSSVLES